MKWWLGSDDDRLWLDCSVMHVQSKRTDGPPVNMQISCFIDDTSHSPIQSRSQPAAVWRWFLWAWAAESRSWCRRSSPTWASLRISVSWWWSKVLVKVQFLVVLRPKGAWFYSQSAAAVLTHAEVVVWYLCLSYFIPFQQLSGEQTCQKVKQNKMGSTT